MAELMILILQNKDGVIDGLKMKATLEKMGLDVIGVVTKHTDNEKVPKELIESIMKIKVMGNVKIDK